MENMEVAKPNQPEEYYFYLPRPRPPKRETKEFRWSSTHGLIEYHYCPPRDWDQKREDEVWEEADCEGARDKLGYQEDSIDLSALLSDCKLLGIDTSTVQITTDNGRREKHHDFTIYADLKLTEEQYQEKLAKYKKDSDAYQAAKEKHYDAVASYDAAMIKYKREVKKMELRKQLEELEK